MENPADKAVVSLIESLCDEVRRLTFESDAAKRQRKIDQIAQLRSSMNLTITQQVSRF